MKLVIGLGGNAILKRGQPLSADNQIANIKKASKLIAQIASEHQIVLTHGNGPQVGLLALQAAAYSAESPYPFDILSAESEGMIGYLLEQQLTNLLPQRKIATLLTQVEVDSQDPAFQKPSKFIGPIYTEEEAKKLATQRGWKVAADGPHFRRVIASPMPQAILELATIRLLIEQEVMVICCGGGGIPIIRTERGYHGVEAVIDKDWATALLAEKIGADRFILLTDVEAVFKDWGTPKAEAISQINTRDLEQYTFEAGSIGPKVAAVCEFVKKTGKKAHIGSLENALAVIEGNSGTLVTV